MSQRINPLALNKKVNNSLNIESRELFQKHKEDDTFYSPVKYFSNSLQAHSKKAQQEEISPWQTSNEDQLNLLGIDFCFKGKSIKEKRRYSNQENDDISSQTVKCISYQHRNNLFQNINENILNTTDEKDFRNQSQYINSNECQNNGQQENALIQNFTIYKDKNLFKTLNTQINNKQTQNQASLNNQEVQSLQQQEIQQQNQLIASIRGQRLFYQQQIQKRRLLSEELQKTGGEKTPIKENSFKNLTKHKNNNSSQSIKKNNSMSDKNLNKLKTNEDSIEEIDIKKNNIVGKQLNESITIMNKNKIISILDNALNCQKRYQKAENQIKNASNSFYSISHKASMIQRHHILSNTQKKKFKFIQLNRSGIFKDGYQIDNNTYSNTQIDDSSILLKKQYKTLENNKQSFNGYSIESNGDYKQNESYNIIRQKQKHNGSENNILLNLSNQLNSSQNISDKRFILQSQKIRSRALSHLISKNTDHQIHQPKKLKSNDQQIKSTTNTNKVTLQQPQINEKNSTTVSLHKKSDILGNKENLYNHSVNETENLLNTIDQCSNINILNNQLTSVNKLNNLIQSKEHNFSNPNLKCTDQVQRSIDFKGKSINKDNKKVMKKNQKIQNTSQLQNDNESNISLNKISLCKPEEIQKQNDKNNIQQNQSQQNVIQSQQPASHRRKESRSLQTEPNITNAHSLLIQGMSKVMNISSYKAYNPQQLYDNNIYLNQIKKELNQNKDNQDATQNEEVENNQVKQDQNIKESNQIKKKSFVQINIDKVNNPHTTPRALSTLNSTHSQQLKSNNIQNLRCTDIQIKKLKDQVTSNKISTNQKQISSNQNQLSCSQPSYSVNLVYQSNI